MNTSLPDDYVFVVRGGRWHVSPNLRTYIAGYENEYPNGWLQAVEFTLENGLLSRSVYDKVSNQGFLWIKGPGYLPPQKPIHQMKDNNVFTL